MGAEVVHTADAGLKRLGFVRRGSCLVYTKGTSIAKTVYQTTMSFVPGSIQRTFNVKKIEDLTASYTYPLMEKTEAIGDHALHFADDKVDQVFNTVHSQKNMEIYHDARSFTQTKVKEVADLYKSEGIVGTARTGVKAGYAKVHQVWSNLPGIGFKSAYNDLKGLSNKIWSLTFENDVAKSVVEKVYKPALDFIVTKYMALHDAVVSAPIYSRAYKEATSLVDWGKKTYIYKQAQKVYPKFSSVLDPLLDFFSPYYNKTLKHLEPKTSATVKSKGKAASKKASSVEAKASNLVK